MDWDTIIRALSFFVAGANDFGQQFATASANTANQDLFNQSNEELLALRQRRQSDAEAFWDTAVKSAANIDGAVRDLRAFIFAGTGLSGAAHIDPDVEQGLN